jgi:uncharacterized protein YoxC
MEDKVSKFASDLAFMEKQLHVLTTWVETLKEKESRIKGLQAEVERLQEVLDELRR